MRNSELCYEGRIFVELISEIEANVINNRPFGIGALREKIEIINETVFSVVGETLKDKTLGLYKEVLMDLISKEQYTDIFTSCFNLILTNSYIRLPFLVNIGLECHETISFYEDFKFTLELPPTSIKINTKDFPIARILNTIKYGQNHALLEQQHKQIDAFNVNQFIDEVREIAKDK